MVHFPSSIAIANAENLFTEQSGQNIGRRNPTFMGEWNWGAFLMNWLWLMNHGKIGLGIGYILLCWIPFVGLGMAIYLGIKGNDLAYDGRRWLNVEQYVAVQNAWRNWGFALTGIVIILAIIGTVVHN